MSRRVAARLVGVALIAHLILSTIAFVTMDADIGGSTVRRGLDHLTDFYELIGFDIFPVGILLLALALGGAWVWLRRGGVRPDAMV
jgi:hypothetical protein